MKSATYRALAVKGPKQIELVERNIPEIETGYVLVQPKAVGICATDLEIIDGTIDPAYVRYPIVFGHEWSATLVEDPSGTLKPGTPLVIEGILPCGRCRQCLKGNTNLCETYDEIGFTRDGGAAELAVIPSRLVHPLDKGVNLSAAALLEPATVVYRGLKRVSPSPGLNVAIIGDGTIALLSAYLMQLWTPANIVMVGRKESQAELAILAGSSNYTTDDSQVGSNFDLVIEASGSIEAPRSAIGFLRRGGTILLLGLPPHGHESKIPIDTIVNGDISIVGSFSYSADAWRDMVHLLNSHNFDPTFLITHRFDLDKWEEALSTLRNFKGPRGKVMLNISDH